MAADSNGDLYMNYAEGASSLEGFIKTQIRQQEKISQDSDNLDSVKRDNFIARALSESRRMSLEVEKSREKRETLHAELGEGRMTQWRDEHSSEVLPPAQSGLADLTDKHG